MNQLRPKLWDCMKNYSKKKFVKDVTSGIIVAIIALPLSIALALASGVTPEKGIYTAIIAGFLIAFFGGSKVQIAGPTAAFATIVAGIVASDGMNGLIVATVMAGIILILMGIFKLGSLIRYIPYTITTGFTAGIAFTIFAGQIKDFLGLKVTASHPLVNTIEKLKYDAIFINTINWQALLVGGICLLILIVWPKVNKVIPASLIAVLAGIFMVSVLGIKALTIGDLYKITSDVPKIHTPVISAGIIKTEMRNAFTIAILAAIESLLSCVVADGMINDRHNSNMELVAQGIGNIAAVLMGGIPATGAIARTAANIKNGGKTPISGMVHSAVLLLVLVVLMPYAALIPMPAIAAILFGVAYNMSGWRQFAYLCKTAPKSDIIVLITTFILTVFFDLVVAIEIGMLLAVVLFMKRMSEETEVQSWIYIDDVDDPDSMELRKVPAHTLVYEINGPMFFGIADKLLDMTLSERDECLILRMRSVNAIDATALHSMEKLYDECRRKKIKLILSHVNEQPYKMMEKAGFIEKLGEKCFCKHIDNAIEFANKCIVSSRNNKEKAI